MTTKHTLECDREAVKKTHNGVRCSLPPCHTTAPLHLPAPQNREKTAHHAY